VPVADDVQASRAQRKKLKLRGASGVCWFALIGGSVLSFAVSVC
jgi:hypothetical protein